ncbi:MAG: hypothetical protein ACRDMV_24435 [Streptosporangiales bacterium]
MLLASRAVPLVDLVDDTFVVAPPPVLAAEFADRASWRRWWPGLLLELDEDRGVEGVRWFVTGGRRGKGWRAGDLTGTSEVWLEPYRDGTIVHFYLRADPVRALPADALKRRRWGDRVQRRHAVAFKRRLHDLKDRLERARLVGEASASSRRR